MNKLRTQAGRVAAYLDEHGTITRLEAMEELGIANLPAVISVMRLKMDMKIKTNRVKIKNRYGEDVTYAEYSWDTEEVE